MNYYGKFYLKSVMLDSTPFLHINMPQQLIFNLFGWFNLVTDYFADSSNQLQPSFQYTSASKEEH